MTRHTIEISEEYGVRYLHFGSGWVQGAMRLSHPAALELEYTRAMMFSLLLRPDPRKILLIGLGAGSLVKYLHCALPRASLTVVEIDPRVENIARLHFHLPDDPERITIRLEDGARFIAAAREQFDLILVDGFDARASAGALDAQDFYLNCRRCLTRQGLMVVNLFGRSLRFDRSTKRIAAAFDDRVLTLPPCRAGNVIALAAAGKGIKLSVSELRERANQLKQGTDLNLLACVSRLAEDLHAFREILVL